MLGCVVSRPGGKRATRRDGSRRERHTQAAKPNRTRPACMHFHTQRVGGAGARHTGGRRRPSLRAAHIHIYTYTRARADVGREHHRCAGKARRSVTQLVLAHNHWGRQRARAHTPSGQTRKWIAHTHAARTRHTRRQATVVTARHNGPCGLRQSSGTAPTESWGMCVTRRGWGIIRAGARALRCWRREWQSCRRRESLGAAGPRPGWRCRCSTEGRSCWGQTAP